MLYLSLINQLQFAGNFNRFCPLNDHGLYQEDYLCTMVKFLANLNYILMLNCLIMIKVNIGFNILSMIKSLSLKLNNHLVFGRIIHI
jgi:hypothetical protein